MSETGRHTRLVRSAHSVMLWRFAARFDFCRRQSIKPGQMCVLPICIDGAKSCLTACVAVEWPDGDC